MQNLSLFKGIMVLGEMREGTILPVTYELLTWGRMLADQCNQKLTCVLLGNQEENLQNVIECGADRAILIKNKSLENFLLQPFACGLERLVCEEKPAVLLAAATTTGRSVMPLLAAKLDTGLTADCTELKMDIETNLLLQTRPAIGGNIMATIKTPKHRPQMATVRPRSAKQALPLKGRKGEILIKQYENELFFSKENFISFIKDATQSINLEEAEIVVAGGRGMKNQEGFKLAERLAETLGGAVGATRDAVELGWATYPHQVGLSGKTISPKLIIALGISGSIQFLAGMKTSEIIIAVNKDPEAQIFKVADFGIVGDVFEVVPMLIARCKNEL